MALIATLALILGRSLLLELLIAAVIAPTIALAFLSWIQVPALARANYRQSVALRAAARFSWDASSYVIESANGSIRLRWNELRGVVEGSDLLLLYQSDLIYNLVPLEHLTSDQRADLSTSVAAVRRV